MSIKATARQIAALESGQPAPMSEAELLAAVRKLARLLKWRVAHFRPGRTSTGWRTPCEADAKGFPDLVMTKGSRLIAAELKSARGRTTDEQLAWLGAFRDCGAEIYIWRPADWPAIVELLTAKNS